MRLKLVSIDTLLEMKLNDEDFTLIEVLSEKNYNKGHIPGAVNADLSELEDYAKNNLKKDETIVTYCASYTCKASTKAARKLQQLGYKHVFDFKGGKREWKHKGLDLEK